MIMMYRIGGTDQEGGGQVRGERGISGGGVSIEDKLWRTLDVCRYYGDELSTGQLGGWPRGASLLRAALFLRGLYKRYRDRKKLHGWHTC
mmetsp:Transcript_24892/g.59085  ORF Transcript_24892/g.59085 Transcript_24892/m.59085 type:complete len:90 (+) Transcript_24892:306-575(+)